MVNLFQRQDHAADERSAQEYLRQLSLELRRRLPEAEAAEIVTETEAHLQDQINALVASGAAETDAVREAVLGFGAPEAYARDATNGMTDSRMAARARGGLGLLSLSIFGIAVSFTLCNGSSPWLLSSLFEGRSELVVLRCLQTATVLTTLAFLVLSFLGRRSSARYLLAGGAMLLLGSVVAVGLYKTVLPSGEWADRRQLQNSLRYERQRIAQLQENTRLLRSGIAAYSRNSPEAVTGDLKRINHYIVPTATKVTLKGVSHDLTFTDLPFRPVERFEAQGTSSFSVRYRPDTYDLVRTYDEAYRQWNKYGSAWLSVSALREQEARERLRQYAWLDQQPQTFQLDCLRWDDLWSIPFTVILLLLDGMASSAGRRVFLSCRRRHRSRTA